MGGIQTLRGGERQGQHTSLIGELLGQVLDVILLRHVGGEVVHGHEREQKQSEDADDQFEENPAGHVPSSKRYPKPRTVVRKRGASGCSSICSRSRRTWTSTVRGVT